MSEWLFIFLEVMAFRVIISQGHDKCCMVLFLTRQSHFGPDGMPCVVVWRRPLIAGRRSLQRLGMV